MKATSSILGSRVIVSSARCDDEEEETIINSEKNIESESCVRRTTWFLDFYGDLNAIGIVQLLCHTLSMYVRVCKHREIKLC